VSPGAWNALRWLFALAALAVLVVEIFTDSFKYAWLVIVVLVVLSSLAGMPAGKGPGAYWKRRLGGEGR
jgi:hypothetical protein